MLENPIQRVPAAEVAGKTLVEEFMAMSYELRRNVLSDKYEMKEVCNDSEADANPKPWRTVTRESQNSIVRRAKRELGDLKGLKASIDEYIHSEETPDYDPIAEYLRRGECPCKELPGPEAEPWHRHQGRHDPQTPQLRA